MKPIPENLAKTRIRQAIQGMSNPMIPAEGRADQADWSESRRFRNATAYRKAKFYCKLYPLQR